MGFSIATIVLDAAPSYNLTTLATAKDELGLLTADTSKDGWINRAITQVSRAIARHTKRVFVVETVQDSFDIEQDAYPYQTPGGFSQLQLSRWPVVEIHSVDLQLAPGSTLTLTEGSDFRVDPESGQLLRLNKFSGAGGRWEATPVTVTYDAGYAVIPEDLEMICLRLITERFKSKDRDPNLIQQETPGIGMQRWWFGGAPGQKGPFAPDIEAALQPFCDNTVA